MVGLVILMVLLQIISLGFAFYCLKLTHNKDIKTVSKFLVNFMKILLFIIIISSCINTIFLLFTYWKSFLVIVIIFESVVNIFIMIEITKYGLRFVNNLNKDILFVKDNSTYLLEVSRLFILYSIINGIGGITLAIIENISNSPNFNYSISISTTFFINLLIGLIFYVLHLLFERSIELDEENKLTI